MQLTKLPMGLLHWSKPELYSSANYLPLNRYLQIILQQEKNIIKLWQNMYIKYQQFADVHTLS